MWILESDGDVFKNKRIWLRPGKSYLFGRTKPETGRHQTGFRINHKTVSRKHLTLSVASVELEAVSQIDRRSEVTFEDAGTKSGTLIDGNQIAAGQKQVLSDTCHKFTLAGYKHTFTITWKPVVFTFTFSSKETKGGKDPLASVRPKLAELDAKAIPNYASGKTTHVITSKRNTARGLQALVQGARIVTDGFVAALEAAAAPTNMDELESFAPLEEDFDGAWPEEAAYLPAPGKEPGPKDALLYQPDSDRETVFKGMTFIFCEIRQYENLQPPIADGGGKAFLFELEPGRTTMGEIQNKVKEAAGESGNGELTGETPVVVVKFGGPKGYEDWSGHLQRDLALALGFRLIEQNEFLDAILVKKPEKLHKRLEYESIEESVGNMPSSRSLPESRGSKERTIEGEDRSQSERATLSVASKDIASRPRRGKVVSVFKGFDDGFDPADIQVETKRPSHLVRSDTDAGDDSTRAASEDKAPSNKKRSLPTSDDESLRELQANMFPGIASMKRRRLEHKALNGDVSSSRQTTRAVSEAVGEDNPSPKKKVKKEMDINAAVRALREAVNAKPKEADEAGVVGVDEMTLAQMQSLAVVEEMYVPDVVSRSWEDKREQKGDRWKDDWSGRKNFKRFRRQGEGANERRRGQKVIVPLEEVKRKDSGIGDGYWSSARNRVDEHRGSREQQNASTITSQARESGSTSALQGSAGALELPNSDYDLETVPKGLQTGDEPEVIDVDAPRTTRASGQVTQTSTTQRSQETSRSKRSAMQSGSRSNAPPKRQKKLSETHKHQSQDVQESNEDDLKLRFRKRR